MHGEPIGTLSGSSLCCAQPVLTKLLQQLQAIRCVALTTLNARDGTGTLVCRAVQRTVAIKEPMDPSAHPSMHEQCRLNIASCASTPQTAADPANA